MPEKFVKKPVVIEAMQFKYPPTKEFLAWCGDNIRNLRKARHPHALAELDIVTLEDGSDGRAKHVATEGDWIIKGVQGEFYACKPDIFHQTYEKVWSPELPKKQPVIQRAVSLVDGGADAGGLDDCGRPIEP